MEKSVQQALSEAVLRLLRPLVRVLLRHGMAYGSFAELARRAYVEEGFEHVAQSGKRASVSSVSAVTGLTRKETKRLAEAAPDDLDASTQRYNRAVRVVSGWVNDARFHDAQGEPAPLAMEGEVPSFAALVKEYSGDIPPAAMLSVLQSAGTVAVSGDRLELLAHAYIPSSTPTEKLHILGTDVGELVRTIGHNLEAPPEQLLFQRKVFNVSLHPDALPEFRRLSNEQSQALLERYHAWLSAHQVDEADEATPAYVAVGIYYAEDTPGEQPE